MITRLVNLLRKKLSAPKIKTISHRQLSFPWAFRCIVFTAGGVYTWMVSFLHRTLAQNQAFKY